MPYEIRQRDGHYQVVNTATGEVHARHTTKAKAEAQVRLLHMVEHGKRPTGRPTYRYNPTNATVVDRRGNKVYQANDRGDAMRWIAARS